MGSRNSDGAEVVGLFALLVLGFIAFMCYQAYMTLKEWADPLGLTVFALVAIIFGVVASALWTGWVLLTGANKARTLPGLLPFGYLCLCPAQTCWASAQPTVFRALAYMPDSIDDSPDVAFWGNHMFEAVVFFGFCGAAYALMRKLDDQYRW